MQMKPNKIVATGGLHAHSFNSKSNSNAPMPLAAHGFETLLQIETRVGPSLFSIFLSHEVLASCAFPSG